MPAAAHVCSYRSFASLGRFISRYFILFDAMVNGIVSLISLSDLSLSVYIYMISILNLLRLALWPNIIYPGEYSVCT